MHGNLKNFFARIVTITLPSRTDRWQRFLDHFPADWPFGSPLRFPAIDGRTNAPPSWWTGGNGAWGCYLSHCKVLEDCLLEGIESVLILEDDVVFRPDFGVRTRQFLAALPCDWQMIYFGGENIEWDKGLPEPINAEVFRPRNVNRTHAYAIRGREMISSVLQHLKAWDKWTARHHIDHHLGAFQANTNSEGLYAPRRWLVDQAGGLSDVSNQRVQHRAFPDCEDLVFPRFDRELTVVLGPYSSGTSAVSAVLNALGIGFMGGEPPSVDKKGTKLYEH